MLCKPLVEHYGFQIGLLCEMYPKNGNLLGLNVNAGQKICLRLRSHSNPDWFLEIREILGTMLHELTHNGFGAHDDKFYRFLDELKDKYFQLELSQNGRANLGVDSNITVFKPSSATTSGKAIANKDPGPKIDLEAIRLKRLNKLTGKVNKLGSASPSPRDPASMREILANALSKRGIPDMKTSSCADCHQEEAPEMDDLTVIDVIDLTEDDEIQKDSPNQQNNDSVIIID